MPTKTPTSSLSAIELLVKRALYRTLARVRRSRSGGTPTEKSAAPSSLAPRLPQEVVEIVIAYLTYDMRSLRACTLTCYSWYIAAVPHLHHTLTIIDGYSGDRRFEWPNPIRYMHMLGLLPLVKKLSVRFDSAYRGGFCPKRFNCCILRQFSALSNVRELVMDHLNIPKFMPRIRRYFGHFLPTVRSLALRKPMGSRRQIIYFIGLFQSLQDLTLHDDALVFRKKLADLMLVPLSVPPLQGRLTIRGHTDVDLLEDMISLFGGLKFSRLCLYNVAWMRLLLHACAKTLRTMDLCHIDPRLTSSLQNIDLSRNKSLRTIQIPASLIVPQGTALSFLKQVLSTTAPSVSLTIVVFYWEAQFRGLRSYPRGVMSQAEIAEEASRHHTRFELLRGLHKTRDFRLMLSACVLGRAGEYPVQMLEQAVAEENAKGGFDNHFPVPSVLYDPCRT